MISFSGLRKFFLPATLVLIALVLCWLNYTPGTILSGWDTLHPEFNVVLYLQRIFWGVWQQHQGLGAVAVQAQASELGRSWYLWVPFRYGYFWLMLVLGPLGVYFLLKKVVRQEAAFLGGLFYLLNLGTMQHFYLPLEMFATAYGFLPWLFLAVYQRRTRLLAVLIFLSAPMAHTPTLWFVNFGTLLLFALFLNRKWAVKVLMLGVIVNSFWLLPTIYSVINHGASVATSQISQQFSYRAILANKEFANLADVALIRGYLFDWGHFNFVTHQFTDLFPTWKSHLNNYGVLAIGYGAFAAAIFGAFFCFTKRISLGKSMLPVFLIAGLGMLSVFDYFGSFNRVLGEALRFPFTKFSLLLILGTAFYFGVFWEFVIGKLLRFRILLVILVGAALVFYMWPAFSGKLVCDCIRIKTPDEYKELFGWFEKQDKDTRIAPFPMDSIYGWQYYGWGYEGAGFRWFGIAQPILDREFDRWNPTNENYYWEMSYALYSKNLSLFESVVEKYRINWLLVDENIINPVSPKALYGEELRDLIAQSDKFSQVATFGKISVYRTTLARPTKNFVSMAVGLPSVAPKYKWGNLDKAFFDFGDYVSADSGEITYQNRTLFTGKRQGDLEFDPTEIAVAGGQVINQDPKECRQVYPEQLGKTTDCKTLYLPDLSHGRGYLISVDSKNTVGLPLLFWVENLNGRRADLETYLPRGEGTSYYIQPPMESDGLGYALHFDSVSIGKEGSINQLGKVTLTPIDYWGLVGRYTGDSKAVSYLGTSNFSVWHPNPAFYRVDLTAKKDTTLILSQSFEPGWVAFGVDDEQKINRLNSHVLIDNWANGWKLSGNERIVYLIFWPQLLEFAGIGLLTLLFFGLIIGEVKRFPRQNCD